MTTHYPIPDESVLERIRSDLSYSPRTGAIRWNKPIPQSNIEIGDLAGCINPLSGYLVITLRCPGRRYPVKVFGHRVAWYLKTGRWPNHAIDHRDRDRANNIWQNLRRSTPAIERINKGMWCTNTSGIRGVFPVDDRWGAKIVCEHTAYWLGVYDRIEDAAEARYQAERDHYGRLTATADRRFRHG